MNVLNKRGHLLRVFTDADGNFGNPVRIVIDEGKRIGDSDRLAITRASGHDETVFVDNLARAEISIFNPQQEVEFAGHPMVGAAWLFAKLSGKPVDTIRCSGNDYTIKHAEELTWVQAELNDMPPWRHKQLKTSAEVERIAADKAAAMEHTMVWAWQGESKGLIRARTFANDWDIPEAEANGSGAMMLAGILNRNIEVKHGRGSVVFAKPLANDQVCVGGRVVEDIDEVL